MRPRQTVPISKESCITKGRRQVWRAPANAHHRERACAEPQCTRVVQQLKLPGIIRAFKRGASLIAPRGTGATPPHPCAPQPSSGMHSACPPLLNTPFVPAARSSTHIEPLPLGSLLECSAGKGARGSPAPLPAGSQLVCSQALAPCPQQNLDVPLRSSACRLPAVSAPSPQPVRTPQPAPLLRRSCQSCRP